MVDARWSISNKELRDAYEKWCSESGEPPLSARAIGRELTTRGYTATTLGHGKRRGWKGIHLLDQSPAWSTNSEQVRTDADSTSGYPSNEPPSRRQPEDLSASVRTNECSSDLPAEPATQSDQEWDF